MAQEIADSTLLDTWGSGGAKIEPDITKIIEGWQLGEQPPHEYMNWLQNTFGSKLNHILKNGIAEWNNETEYLAGASVQHSGNVWLCKTTNTNSEPTELNNNWKQMPSLENLALTVDIINDFPLGATTGDTCIVKDLDRGGIFIYDSTKVDEDNQGTNFNGWIRQYSGAVNVKWFGAKGDGVTDDTVAIQSAIDYLGVWNTNPVGGIIFLPKGKYMVSSPLVVNMNCSLVGEGNQYTTMIKATDTFIGDAIIIGTNPVTTYVITGFILNNIGIYTNNKQCHGVIVYNLHTNSKLSNLFISGIADNYSALRIVPGETTTYISESFVLENIIAWHYSATATAPTIFLDTCHEATLINVKSFGCQANIKAPAIPIHIRNSRGITMVSCSVAFSSVGGLLIDTTNRFTEGINVLGLTIEGVDGYSISTNGASGSNYCKGIYIGNPRDENCTGDFIKCTNTSYSLIETPAVRPARLLSGCTNNTVICDVKENFIDTSGQPNQARYTGYYVRSYITNDYTTFRAFNATTATLEDTKNLVATLINDLAEKGITKITVT